MGSTRLRRQLAGPLAWFSILDHGRAVRRYFVSRRKGKAFQRIASLELGSGGLVVAMDAEGFGYIIPGVVPAGNGREVVSDPAVFGLGWPALVSAGGFPACYAL
jgi:hypothetical protein